MSVLLLIISVFTPPVSTSATGLVTDCSNAVQLRQLLVQTNLIIFACSGTPTITVDDALALQPNTVIDGSNNGHRITLSGQGQTRIFTVASGTDATLINLTLRAGNSHGSDGGAILNNGTLIISHTTFMDNTARRSSSSAGSRGGAIANTGTLQIVQSTFYTNTASYGGAIFDAGALTITDSSFGANASSDAFGGAIATGQQATLGITGSLFDHNTALGGGGALALTSPATVSTSIFHANDSGGGGAILGGPALALRASTLDSNTSLGDGGAIGNTRYLTVTGTTFVGNAAGIDGNGGAISVPSQGHLLMTNSTLVSNTAWLQAGGISNGGTAALTNVTLVGNQTMLHGSYGGNLAQQSYAYSMTLHNTIVADGLPLNCSPGMTSAGFNLESADTCGLTQPSDQRATDPQLRPLAANGGPTATEAPQATSPVIDIGDPTNCPATDQRGAERPQRSGCDRGAYEYGAVPRITGFAPPFAIVGDPPQPLLIQGGGFIVGSRVRLNGMERPTHFLSGTALQVELSSADLNRPAAVTVDVVNPGPDDGISTPVTYYIGPRVFIPLVVRL